MRVQIKIDGAETEQVRELAVALHRVGLTGRLEVGVEGPDFWKAETPMMTPSQWARVVLSLVKMHGTPVAELMEELR